MGVIHAVLTIVTLALLGVVGYALAVVLCLRLRDPVLRSVAISEMPPEVMEALWALAEEMRDEGLSLAALQHEQRAAGGSAWAAVGCDSTGTTWAVAQCDRTLFTREQRVHFTLYSRLARGSVIVTARKSPTLFVTPGLWRMTLREFDRVSAQWEAHRETIEAYGGMKNVERMANYEEFREWLQKQAGCELDTLFEKGLVTNGSQDASRFEFAKLHLPLWQGMLEIGLWMRVKAGPRMLSAKIRAIEGFRLARARAMEWKENRERARAPGRQSGGPAVVAAVPPEKVPPQVAPMPGPGEEMAVPSQLLEGDPHAPGARSATPAPETPVLPPRAAAEPLAPLAPAVTGPYVPSEFTMLMPAEPGFAPSPAVPKSRLELYREAKSRLSLPGCLGWSLQGILQCAALAVFLLVVLSGHLTDVTTWWLIGAVLVLHEAGHGIAMKIAGFRHRAVFFLPVIGWLAAGRHTCVSPRKEFWIHLMGPLPGLVAGWGVLLWNYFDPGRPEWLLDGAFWAVLLNTFFLLPFNPLDGGRIADLVYFNRHPYLRVAYYLCGGVALGALYFLSPVLLVLPLVVLAQVPEAFRTRRLSGVVRRAVHSVDPEEGAALKIFRVIESSGNERLYKRFAWAATIDRLLRLAASQQFGFVGRACGAGLHLALLFLPLVALVAYGATLRKEQARGLGEASGRIAALEQQVRWVGAPLDVGNRRILEQMQAADDGLVPGWAGLKRLFAAGGFGGDPAEAGMLAPGTRAEVVALARRLNWSQVGTWIVESEEEAHRRRSLITGVVSALIEAAKEGSGPGDDGTVERDLSIAYWAIISCEPRRSFAEWRKWCMLESEVLVTLEELAAAQRLSEGKRAWFSMALSQAPRPEGRKLALLLLRDLTDGRVFSGDLSGGRELMGWGETAGNSVWDPDPEATRAEVAASVRARMEEPGVPSPGEDRRPSHRVRLANATHHSMTFFLSGEHLPTCFKVADQWSRQAEATPCQPGQGDNLRVIDSWNLRLRPILRVNRFRELAAAGLAASRPALPPGELAGLPVTVEQDANGRRLALAVPDPDGGPGQIPWTWRLPPEAREAEASLPSPTLPPRRETTQTTQAQTTEAGH